MELPLGNHTLNRPPVSPYPGHLGHRLHIQPSFRVKTIRKCLILPGGIDYSDLTSDHSAHRTVDCLDSPVGTGPARNAADCDLAKAKNDVITEP